MRTQGAEPCAELGRHAATAHDAMVPRAGNHQELIGSCPVCEWLCIAPVPATSRAHQQPCSASGQACSVWQHPGWQLQPAGGPHSKQMRPPGTAQMQGQAAHTLQDGMGCEMRLEGAHEISELSTMVLQACQAVRRQHVAGCGSCAQHSIRPGRASGLASAVASDFISCAAGGLSGWPPRCPADSLGVPSRQLGACKQQRAACIQVQQAWQRGAGRQQRAAAA